METEYDPTTLMPAGDTVGPDSSVKPAICKAGNTAPFGQLSIYLVTVLGAGVN